MIILPKVMSGSKGSICCFLVITCVGIYILLLDIAFTMAASAVYDYNMVCSY